MSSSARSRRPLLTDAAWATTLAGGLLLDLWAFGTGDPVDWVPDVVVGWVLLGRGWSLQRRAVPGRMWLLLAAAGATWFLGSADASLAYLHRGVLVQALVGYPDGRVPDRSGRTVVAAGYLVAVVPVVWQDTALTAAAALGLVVALFLRRRHTVGRVRRDRTYGLWLSVGFGAVLVLGAVARALFPEGDADLQVLLGYQLTVVLVAVALAVARPTETVAGPKVADMVVSLGTAYPGGVRGELARALGDPTLQVGLRVRQGYVDESGAQLTADPKDGRAVTFIERGGEPVAVLVHDPALAGDAALTEAVQVAADLMARNAALHDELRRRLAQVEASRRRLVVAGDLEQTRLGQRLDEGAQRRLREVGEALSAATARPAAPVEAAVAAARSQLALADAELRELAEGLHPGILTRAGLGGALRDLAGRSALPVEVVRCDHAPLAEDLALALWFVCLESLTNAVKHADASQVRVSVATTDDEVVAVVADDGHGGADVRRGSGLRGLADRVEALGGCLEVVSPPGAGTTVTVRLPQQ